MSEPGRQPLLTASHISKRFGITRALDDVSVSFLPGEVHALMGENGAGKSTLGRVIAGLHKPDSGTVTIAGRQLDPGNLQTAFDAGIRIVHQEPAQCPNLSVAENLCLHDLPRRRFIIDRAEMRRRARRLLERIEPEIDPDAMLGRLSPGHRQIVQIAAALDERAAAVSEASKSGAPSASQAARVIVFDEPTSSLSITETERLLQIIRQLASQGIACIYVSHRMSEIFSVCNRVTVLRDGRFVATTPAAELDEPALVEQMIGRRIEAPSTGYPAAPRRESQGTAGASAAPPLLDIRSISSTGKLRDISFSVRPGEILGIGGLVGSGRSELLDAIFGLDPASSGTVLVAGEPLRRHAPRRSIRAKIGYVPEDRRLQGLFFQLGIAENILIPIMPRLARAGIRSLGAERRIAGERIREFQVKAASPNAVPGSLSGGNQQKLLIARWMSDDARVLLLDEPTRGIDVGTKAEVHRLIRSAAGCGAAIVLVSSEMPELLALSDRIIALCRGRVAGELRGDDMTQANILRLATIDSLVTN